MIWTERLKIITLLLLTVSICQIKHTDALFLYKTVTVICIVIIASFMYTNVMLKTMGRGQELLKKHLYMKTFKKHNLEVIHLRRMAFFLKKGNVVSNIQMLNKPRLGSDAKFH